MRQITLSLTLVSDDDSFDADRGVDVQFVGDKVSPEALAALRKALAKASHAFVESLRGLDGVTDVTQWT